MSDGTGRFRSWAPQSQSAWPRDLVVSLTPHPRANGSASRWFPLGSWSQIPGFLESAGFPQVLMRENITSPSGPRWPSPRATHIPVLRPQGRHKSSEMLPGLVWATPPPQQAGHGARTAQGPGHSLGLGKSVLCLPSWLLGPETRAFPACAQQWTPAGEPSCCPQDLQLYQRHLQPNRAASIIH